jgi:hypothetical protein
MTGEPLTIESLARVLHEINTSVINAHRHEVKYLDPVANNFDDLHPIHRRVRMEQARLLFERIMR